jgi:O-antigen/teichoic acid export membrane protein
MFHIELKFISFRFILNLLRAESTVFFSMIVINLYTITNTVMLGWLRPVEEVGYYTAALRLLLVATSIVNIPLAQAFYPYIGQAFGVSKEYGIQKVVKMIPIIFWLTVVMSCCMFTCGPTILLWFYGPAFSQSLPVFKILAFAPVIIAFSNIFGIQVMLNLKMDKSFFWITAGGAILGLCLNFLMTSSFGYVGTAWNWFIVEIYVTFSMYVYLKRSGIELISIRNFNPGASYAHIKPLFLKMIKR